jgi:uroporphyrinogen decarboxylase
MAKPLVEAALGRRPARYPVWFMRQAGRYLPEYREVRAKVDFTALCQTPKLAAEVTIQPLRRYDLDAAIIFSDILIPAVGMGQVLTFDKGEGPVLSNPVRSMADLKNLKRPDAEKDLGYVGEAIALTKASLKPEQTMIGFAGAPFTVASYMIEGQSSKTFTEVKRLLFKDLSTFKALLDHIGDVTISYLEMQVKSGADALMLFDTWAAMLTGPDYRDHVFPVTKRVIAEARKTGVPVTYFPGQGADRLYELQGLEVDVISVDWRTRIANAQSILKSQGLNVTLQGNLDPQQLIAPEGVVRQKVRDVVEEAKKAAPRAHIFNVGHGLLPHTPPESLGWVIDELRKVST